MIFLYFMSHFTFFIDFVATIKPKVEVSTPTAGMVQEMKSSTRKMFARIDQTPEKKFQFFLTKIFFGYFLDPRTGADHEIAPRPSCFGIPFEWFWCLFQIWESSSVVKLIKGPHISNLLQSPGETLKRRCQNI